MTYKIITFVVLIYIEMNIFKKILLFVSLVICIAAALYLLINPLLTGKLNPHLPMQVIPIGILIGFILGEILD